MPPPEKRPAPPAPDPNWELELHPPPGGARKLAPDTRDPLLAHAVLQAKEPEPLDLDLFDEPTDVERTTLPPPEAMSDHVARMMAEASLFDEIDDAGDRPTPLVEVPISLRGQEAAAAFVRDVQQARPREAQPSRPHDPRQPRARDSRSSSPRDVREAPPPASRAPSATPGRTPGAPSHAASSTPVRPPSVGPARGHAPAAPAAPARSSSWAAMPATPPRPPSWTNVPAQPPRPPSRTNMPAAQPPRPPSRTNMPAVQTTRPPSRTNIPAVKPGGAPGSSREPRLDSVDFSELPAVFAFDALEIDDLTPAEAAPRPGTAKPPPLPPDAPMFGSIAEDTWGDPGIPLHVPEPESDPAISSAPLPWSAAAISPPFDSEDLRRSPPRNAPAEKLSAIEARIAAGDYGRALVLAEAALEEHPGDPSVSRHADGCRDMLYKRYLERLGASDHVPQLAVQKGAITGLSLDHRAGFLLSCVDGGSTVEEIIDVSAMPRLDAVRILYELVQEGVVEMKPRR